MPDLEMGVTGYDENYPPLIPDAAPPESGGDGEVSFERDPDELDSDRLREWLVDSAVPPRLIARAEELWRIEQAIDGPTHWPLHTGDTSEVILAAPSATDNLQRVNLDEGKSPGFTRAEVDDLYDFMNRNTLGELAPETAAQRAYRHLHPGMSRRLAAMGSAELLDDERAKEVPLVKRFATIWVPPRDFALPRDMGEDARALAWIEWTRVCRKRHQENPCRDRVGSWRGLTTRQQQRLCRKWRLGRAGRC